MWLLPIENKKNNLSKLFTGKSFLGQKSHWTIVSLDNCVIGQKSLGELSPWTIVPWTVVATPIGPNWNWPTGTELGPGKPQLVFPYYDFLQVLSHWEHFYFYGKRTPPFAEMSDNFSFFNPSQNVKTCSGFMIQRNPHCYFLGSMLPQYMALCVSFVSLCVMSKKNFMPLLNKVGG